MSKGPRDQIKARAPIDFVEATRQAAAREGLTINDFILDAVAAKIGRPWTDQERLPIAKAA